MKLYDITAPIYSGMPVHPGDPEVTLESAALPGADGVSVSRLCLGTHTGTHVDPPLHMLEGGNAVDAIPLETLVGPALVVEAAGPAVGRTQLENSGIGGASRLLIKTRAGGGPHGYLTEDAAGFLVEQGVVLVGIDAPSVDGPGQERLPAHRILLSAGVVVVEGLELSGITPGAYGLICLPLRLSGGDGAPARVVLRDAGP